jgi:hypothetical protein
VPNPPYSPFRQPRGIRRDGQAAGCVISGSIDFFYASRPEFMDPLRRESTIAPAQLSVEVALTQPLVRACGCGNQKRRSRARCANEKFGRAEARPSVSAHRKRRSGSGRSPRFDEGVMSRMRLFCERDVQFELQPTVRKRATKLLHPTG